MTDATTTTERKTIHRWIWVWDFEKEERWLNEMAMEGWVLGSVDFCTYHFIKCEPGQYIIRMELVPSNKDYLDFIQDIGAECIGRMVKWCYFRRAVEMGPFDLLVGIDAKIDHLERISKMLRVVCLANIALGVSGRHAASIANLLCAALLSYALGRIHGKKEHLEAERIIHE